MPEYQNPDPLVRLIGEANEAPAIVEGVSITSLVDSGPCMSAMVKSFAEELQLEIKPLKTILDIEATGDGSVPYHGYVECHLQLPQIKKFDVDVLMLVIDDSAYGMRVPIQIGTLHIDMALELATEAKMKKFSCKWDRAKMATALCMNSMVVSEDQKFKLDDVLGSVHTTQKMMLGPFESITVSGIRKGPVKNSAYHKHVNVSVEPLEAHKEGESKFCAVPRYTFLKPGSDRLKVMIKNLTTRAIKVPQGSKVASMEAANVIPHMLAPQDTTPSRTETNIMKITNVEVSHRDLPTSDNNPKEQCTTSMFANDVGPLGNPIEAATSKSEVDRTPLPPEQMKQLFEQIKLEEGTFHWTEEQHSKVRTVIEEYSFLFAMNSLDFGRTDLVKHHIQLDNYTPIKDRYCRISPHQYEEVPKHLKEMLDIGAIRRSNSPWASPVVLVRKKDGSLRFCIDLRKLNAQTVKDAYSLPHIDALWTASMGCASSPLWTLRVDTGRLNLTKKVSP